MGESAHPAHGFRVSRLAADVHCLLGALDIRRAVLCGTSLGFTVIMSYLELFGYGRVDGVAFVDQSACMAHKPGWATGAPELSNAAQVAALCAQLSSDFEGLADGIVSAGFGQVPPSDSERAFLRGQILKCDPVLLGGLMWDHANLDFRDLLPMLPCHVLNFVGGRLAAPARPPHRRVRESRLPAHAAPLPTPRCVCAQAAPSATTCAGSSTSATQRRAGATSPSTRRATVRAREQLARGPIRARSASARARGDRALTLLSRRRALRRPVTCRPVACLTVTCRPVTRLRGTAACRALLRGARALQRGAARVRQDGGRRGGRAGRRQLGARADLGLDHPARSCYCAAPRQTTLPYM